MKKLLKVLFVSSVLVFAGCEGEEGPQGPQGPAGADGNANVKTEIFEVEGTEWSQTSSTLSYFHSTDVLSQNVVDNGLVHVYLQGTRSSTGDSTWIELPYSVSAGSINYWLHNNELEITSGLDLTGQTSKFRMIAVEGELQNAAKIDFSNYEEVKAAFNLSDDEF